MIPCALASFASRARLVVDRVGQRLVERAGRIVGQRSQIADRVDAREVGGADVAHVGADQTERGMRPGLAENVLAKKVAIEADDALPCGEQHVDDGRADVSPGAGDEHCVV